MVISLIAAAAIHLCKTDCNLTGVAWTKASWSTEFVEAATEELRFNNSCGEGMKIIGTGTKLDKALWRISHSNTCAWLENRAIKFQMPR